MYGKHVDELVPAFCVAVLWVWNRLPSADRSEAAAISRLILLSTDDIHVGQYMDTRE